MHQVMWTPGVTLDQMERLVVEAALTFYRGNKSATASALAVSVRTIDNKIEKYAADDQAAALAGDARRQAEAEFLRRARQVPAALLVLEGPAWPPFDPALTPLLAPEAPRASDTPPAASAAISPISASSAPVVAPGRSLPPPAAYGQRSTRR